MTDRFGAAVADHPLVQLTLMRFREFWREPESVFWVFVFPILMATTLGIAFRNGTADLFRVAAVTPAVAGLLSQEKLLDVHEMSSRTGEQALRAGKVALLVEPGPGATLVYRYDDTHPDGRTARILADRVVQRAAGRVDPVATTDRSMRESGSRYVDLLIPGLLGVSLGAIWQLGFAVVDARRKKLMKRLIATPMRRHHYLLSFVLYRLLLMVAETVVLLGFGVLVFGVPLRGSLWVLALLCALGCLSFSALGLLVASRVRTTEAVSGLTNLVMIPMWMVCGVFFSTQRFPDAVQPIIEALPLTALIGGLRANMLQGASLSQLAEPMAILAGWLIVCFALALRLFRWG